MIDVIKFPKKIIIAREAHDVDSELRADIMRLQNSYSKLRDMTDFQCPISIEELTTDEIDRVTQERICKAQADDFMLPSEKQARIEKYKTLHRAVVRQLNIVSAVLQKWADAGFVYDPVVRNITPTANLEAIIEKRCQREVPAIAAQHGRLITNVRQAIERLRLFEQGENVSKIRLEQLCALDTESLAAMWADGSIKRKVLSDDPWMRNAASMRNFQEQQYL